MDMEATGARTVARRVKWARVHAALGDPTRLAVVDVVHHDDVSPQELARRLGDRVPLDTERGYHATLSAPTVQPLRPIMDCERKFIATPEDYLRGRPSLRRTLLLIDSRVGMKDSDEAALTVLDESAVATSVVLTKVDKLRDKEVPEQTADVEARLKAHAAAFARLTELATDVPAHGLHVTSPPRRRRRSRCRPPSTSAPRTKR